MRYYISGGISRCDREDIRARFLEGVRVARGMGGEDIVDPSRYSWEGYTQREYMESWVVLIQYTVGVMVMCTGWESSRGAVEERELALGLGIQVVYV